LPDEKLKNFNPDVFKVFESKIARNIRGMRAFIEKLQGKEDTKTTILNEDTRRKTSIPDATINLVITSPPYGDSKTTVAYGQFSRLSLQWLGFSGDDLAIDTKSLGGKILPLSFSYYSFNSPILKHLLFLIAEKSKTRARDVLRFFLDLKQCLKEIYRVVAPGGIICMVIGNRTVKGIRIPTDEIVCEMGENLGLEHIKTIIRDIPSKRMPSKTSPTNIPGLIEQTILKEHIIILRKGG
jgi:DNA modification methylase